MRIFVILVALTYVTANAQEVGDTIRLAATNPLGVPLHREARSSMFDRAPDQSLAGVLELANQGRWLRIETENGAIGWIVERYVGSVVDDPPPPPDPDADELAVWSSPQGCETVVNAGRRMEATEDDVLRIATWNIRWFPHSSNAIPQNPDDLTDLGWVACALAWINADIVAIQEIRTTDDAQDAMDSVLDGLNGLTGDVWNSDLQECGAGVRQHVGYIWNTARVALSNGQDLWQLNGRADDASQPCRDSLRPGRYAFADAEVDFNIVVVHSDSGTEERDRDTRQSALDRIDQALAPFISTDQDTIILGDFNTMGQEGVETAAEEIADFQTDVANETPGFTVVSAQPSCSEYFNQHPGLLDHILVEDDMDETFTTPARVTGYCALANCDQIDGDMPLAFDRLSDHCPVVFSIENQDRD